MNLAALTSPPRCFEHRRNFQDIDQVSLHIFQVLFGRIECFTLSGHGKTVLQSLDVLKSLYETTRQVSREASWVLNILPGSGIDPDTVGPILDSLLPHGLQEIHLSGGSWIESGMEFRKEGMGMGEWAIWSTNEEKVRRVRQVTDATTTIDSERQR